MPSVSLRPTNWIREDVIFFSQHGPFPDYLKRFHLSDSDFCRCGGVGTEEWLKRVANNLVTRHKIHGNIKLTSENRDLFFHLWSSTFQCFQLKNHHWTFPLEKGINKYKEKKYHEPVQITVKMPVYIV
ncbi:hypothetical protein AVEN_175274-1 [Araneus ventricosus]|uniref:Uncharacterized protein n=1 Tax=Araneus ventricosus TaxID=182803 RepID=A0A4Y2F1I9_ARAVE|nr:hypothetical protein AVEN_175274-1 [Araneus ventricosus]